MNTILITGASSGIGEALALYYANEGVQLYINGRNKERLQGVADNCREKGAEVSATLIDVTDALAMQEWIVEVDNKYPIDLIIANAGVGIPGDDEATVRQTFKVNIEGVLNTVLPVLPFMKQRGRGQIAIISSIAGYRGLSSAPAYSASKAAVKAWGEGIRGKFAHHGIKVSVVCPGFVRSRITDKNTCPMPFFMEADKAAAVIAKGFQKNRKCIAFPLPMALLGWLLAVIPSFLLDFINKKTPEKT